MAGSGVAAASGVVTNGARGRFIATAELTDKQATFVREYVANGGNAMRAATVAGYATPHSDGWRLIRNRAVAAAIDAEIERDMQRGTAKAIAVLDEIMSNPEVAPQHRIAAARTRLEAAGRIGRARKDEANGDKSYAEMTADELAELVRQTAAFIAENEGSGLQIDAVPPGLTPDVTDIDPETGAITTA